MKTRRYLRGGKLVLCLIALTVFSMVFCVACTGNQGAESDSDGHLILNCTFDYLRAGESRRYYVRQSPSSAGYKTVWESSDENVASVDNEGTVKALSAGKTQITVRAENTPYKAVLKLTVADEIVSAKDGENALQEAVDKLKNNASVFVVGGYYPSLKVNKKLTLTGAEGAAVGDVEIAQSAELYMYSMSVYAPSSGVANASVIIGKDARFTAVGCSFLYDDPTGEKMSKNAVNASSDAAVIYCRACSFSGYKTSVGIGATDGDIYLVNNDFSSAETAVEIDLRIDGSNEDKAATGKVADNVYVGCKNCVKLYYNALSYTGGLEISDDEVNVPS